MSLSWLSSSAFHARRFRVVFVKAASILVKETEGEGDTAMVEQSGSDVKQLLWFS